MVVVAFTAQKAALAFFSVEGYHCIGQLTPPYFGTSMSHRTKGDTSFQVFQQDTLCTHMYM